MNNVVQKATPFLQMVPGLVYVGVIALMATVIGNWISAWFQLETLTIAIILGMLLNNLVGTAKWFKAGIDFSQKTLLLFGIVLLGLKLNPSEIGTMGLPLILSVIVYVITILVLVYIFNRFFKLSPKLAALVGVGSSICGAAAVVALAPTIKASKEESVLAVTLVSFLGALGVLFMAAISSFSSLTDIEFGIWAGMTLHGVAHAIAGAFVRGDYAGEIGTFVKMMRVMMLVPISIALSIHFSPDADSIKKRSHIPTYLWGFIIATAIKATGLLPTELVSIGQVASQQFILLAMTAMGLSVTFKEIAGKGLKVINFGLLLFALSASAVYVILLYL